MMKPWPALVGRLYNILKEYEIHGHRLVVAVSGGADSTALLRGLILLQNVFDLEIDVVHCHHGRNHNLEFRDRSLDFVVTLCESWNVPLHIFHRDGAEGDSESVLRDFRHTKIADLASQIRGSQDLPVLRVFAHHQDDLMETRLLRLLRGTGEQGLQAMKILEGDLLRPFLALSRVEIEEFLREIGQEFMVDPEAKDLRSFLRREWLPALERRLPGGSKALARSLENLARPESAREAAIDGQIEAWARDRVFLKQDFSLLDLSLKKRALSLLMRRLGMRNYTGGQIKEILKHLDKEQNVHSFRIAGLDWQVDKEFIRVSPPLSW